MKQNNDWAITLNGHRIEARQVIEADALDGWIEVVDYFDRGQAKNPIVTDHPKLIVTRRLYGCVTIRYRGIPLPRATARD